MICTTWHRLRGEVITLYNRVDADAIGDVLAAISAGKVVTDIQGRSGALRMRAVAIHCWYELNCLFLQAFQSENKVNEDRTTPGVTDDIVSDSMANYCQKMAGYISHDQPQLEQLGDRA